MGKYGDGHASGRVAWWWRLRPGLLVLVTLAGVALFVVLVVAPSTGAAGGCGGG